MARMNIEDYLKLPYTLEVIRDERDGKSGYFAKVVELPGCMTQADSFEELSVMVREAMSLWIETAMEDGETIPLPKSTEDYSGKFMVRLPKSLHRDLSILAKQEGVSLNAFVSITLGQVTAQRKGHTDKHISLAA